MRRRRQRPRRQARPQRRRLATPPPTVMSKVAQVCGRSPARDLRRSRGRGTVASRLDDAPGRAPRTQSSRRRDRHGRRHESLRRHESSRCRRVLCRAPFDRGCGDGCGGGPWTATVRIRRHRMRRYGRLDEPTSDAAGDDAAEARRRRRAVLLERVANKIHAGFWVALAGLVTYYGDVVGVATDAGRSST